MTGKTKTTKIKKAPPKQQQQQQKKKKQTTTTKTGAKESEKREKTKLVLAKEKYVHMTKLSATAAVLDFKVD